MKNFFKNNSVYLAWGVALMAMLGSLYFSEIAKFPPCVLCWYQRVCIYPAVFVIGAGIILKNRLIHWYVLPMSVIGILIGVYHNLLYYKILPEAIAPCVNGVSCTTKYIEWAGFITIPLLALLASTIITILMIVHWRMNRND